jgi:DNA-binding LacI/PurR family transcriptional regulator
MKSKPPSSQDVAALAGVSRAQVSYVLNGRRPEHVSADNRQKIIDAALALGYSPQRSAQALAKGYANKVALFFPAPYPFHINAMIGAIHETGLVDGCIPVQYSFNSYHDPERKRLAFRDLIARKPRGLFCSLFDVTLDDVEEARKRGIKHIVLYDIEPHEGYPTLVLPVRQIAAAAVEHLRFRGHRRIGILRPSDSVQAKSYQARLQGAQAVLGTSAELFEWPWPGETRPTLAGARTFLASGAPKVTALYAYNDEYAFPVLTAARELGLKVPGDLAVIGANDLPHDDYVSPPLTSVSLGELGLGQRAVELINGALLGTAAPAALIVPRVVLRAST